MLLLFSVTIASCSNTNNEDGRYSIYLLAKEKGYTGTYEEWIESLKGDKVVLVVEGDELKWKYSEEDNTKYRTLITLSSIKGKDGVEDGKDVDKTIFYHNLYNIEELNKIIKTLFTQA